MPKWTLHVNMVSINDCVHFPPVATGLTSCSYSICKWDMRSLGLLSLYPPLLGFTLLVWGIKALVEEGTSYMGDTSLWVFVTVRLMQYQVHCDSGIVAGIIIQWTGKWASPCDVEGYLWYCTAAVWYDMTHSCTALLPHNDTLHICSIAKLQVMLQHWLPCS